jgi:hypothetical protein
MKLKNGDFGEVKYLSSNICESSDRTLVFVFVDNDEGGYLIYENGLHDLYKNFDESGAMIINNKIIAQITSVVSARNFAEAQFRIENED